MIPLYLNKLNERANSGFLACEKLTWADFFLASFKDYFNWAIKDDFNDFAAYPNLHAIVEKISNLPAIKKWLEERPVGMM